MAERVVHTAHNIKTALEGMAVADTARYIMENEQLSKAEQIDGKKEMLDWALAKAPKRGYILEFGVGFGGSLKHIANWLSDNEDGECRVAYGFDSFKGLPEAWRSTLPKGTFSRAGMMVDKILETPNVCLYEGWFEDTIPKFLTEHGEMLDKYGIAFMHIDSDLYSSAATILESELNTFLRNRSVILFNEYWNWPAWQYEARGEHWALLNWSIPESAWRYVAYNVSGQEVAIRMEPNGE